MKLWAHMFLGDIESLHSTKKAAQAARDKEVKDWEGHCFPEDHTVQQVKVED